MITNILVGVGLLSSGLVLGYVIHQLLSAREANSLEQKSKKIILEAQEKAAALLEEAKKENRERKNQLDKAEERLLKKDEILEQRSRELNKTDLHLKEELANIDQSKKEVAEVQKKAIAQLEKISGLSAEEAKTKIFKEVENQHRHELVKTIQSLEKEKREEVEKKSLEIITTALQRYARSHVADLTTTVFNLPNEEMKGKIIGREGRNIRTLERLTGAEIIVDEAPDSIIISSFDPLRRETARLTLEKLLKDGRIQPAKIEEKVEEAKREMEKRMQEVGEQAALEIGVIDFPKEILQLLGRLYFRTSYGQNVLVHSIEMAHISGMIAAEIGANVDIAKRAALLHDIGKAISHEVEGTHVNLGRKILQKYGIDEKVIRGMESHHEEYPFSTPESFIVTAADILSAARPGARRDTVESYLKRLQDLEKIATSFDGIKTAYALSAGREIRIFVVPEKIDDFGALQLAKSIAGKIQSELKYPGEIKVNVIRETRAVEYAK
jgi:ribonuclease Y